MKKQVIITILILTTFLTGCNSKENQDTSKSNINNKTEIKTSSTNIQKTVENKTNNIKNTSIFINEQDNGETGKFYIGMNKEDVMSVLKSLKIEVSNETEITSDEGSWGWGNKVLDAGDLSFTFDKEQKLYEIIVFDGNIPTALGLKIGDSIDNMDKLYGKNYVIYQTDNATIYEYSIGSNCFYVAIEGDNIVNWGISKYKFDK